MTNEVEYWTERLIKEVVLLGHPAEFGRLLAANLGSEKASAVWPFMSRTISRLRLRTLLMKCLPSAMNETHGRRKKEAEYYSQKVNAWYNRDRKKDQD